MTDRQTSFGVGAGAVAIALMILTQRPTLASGQIPVPHLTGRVGYAAAMPLSHPSSDVQSTDARVLFANGWVQGDPRSPILTTVDAANTVPAEAVVVMSQPQPVVAVATSVPATLSAVAPPGNYNLMRPPTITAARIEQLLQQYHSPALGNGQTFYDLGVKYGVDPAFMMAFFVHESAAGTMGAAVATRSVGNLICSGWAGTCIGRFRAYNSYAQAAEDWYQLITGPLYIGAGLTTPDQITPRYAPSSDNNDPNGYAKTVERMVGSWAAGG